MSGKNHLAKNILLTRPKVLLVVCLLKTISKDNYFRKLVINLNLDKKTM